MQLVLRCLSPALPHSREGLHERILMGDFTCWSLNMPSLPSLDLSHLCWFQSTFFLSRMQLRVVSQVRNWGYQRQFYHDCPISPCSTSSMPPLPRLALIQHSHFPGTLQSEYLLGLPTTGSTSAAKVLWIMQSAVNTGHLVYKHNPVPTELGSSLYHLIHPIPIEK